MELILILLEIISSKERRYFFEEIVIRNIWRNSGKLGLFESPEVSNEILRFRSGSKKKNRR